MHFRLGDGLSVPGGSASVTTWSSIASRPKRASSNFAGALPGRKPGSRTCLASSL
ncbi:hypothetical protein I549_4833 [Mycobacterium avium subsp. avium 2285 (R)]|nr:hypothetical protein I549_4833 [Mycobacterium avium subsp. avium 2285 (R)]